MIAEPTTGAEARHEIANLLHTYVDIADRKDIAAGVALLGETRVRFPTGGFDNSAQARTFLERLWGAPEPHRHDVFNLVVEPGDVPDTWTARAHYTRWVFEPEPVLHTLGEYTLTVIGGEWRISELTVTRTWTRP